MTGKQSPALEFHGSRLFAAWLKNAGVSLAFTTYQAGKVFFIGMQPDDRLSVLERTFERPMGLGTGPGRFWMSSAYSSGVLKTSSIPARRKKPDAQASFS